MSIIQEALKKAQGDYLEKKITKAIDEPVKQPERLRKEDSVHISKETAHQRSVRLPALVGVLIVLFLVYWFKPSLKHSQAPQASKADTVDVKKQGNAAAVPMPSPKAVESFVPSKLDPINFITMRPLNLTLNGIMYLESKPQAIINGHVLEEGDKINRATILAIEKDCVLLDIDDTNVRLELGR